VAPIITGIIVHFRFHIRCISIHYYYYYICYLQLGCRPVAVLQYTFTHKQYIEQHNRHKQYIEHKWQQNNANNNIWKNAGRAPSLRVLPWHLPYNWGKSTERTKSG
jgi:hypothetical protein